MSRSAPPAAPGSAAARGSGARSDVAGGTGRRWVRRGAAAALLVGGWILLLSGTLQVCEQQLSDSGKVASVCHSPHADDPRVLGLLIIALLLVVPDLSEFSVPGLGSLRLRIADTERRTSDLGDQVVALDARLSSRATAVNRTTVMLSAPTSAAESAVQLGPEPDPALAVRPVVEARLQLGEAALRALLEPRDGPLAGARMHLYVPDDDQLLPVSDPRLSDEDGWQFGEGVVGSAWEAHATVYSRGAQVHQDVEHLSVERRAHYAPIAVVVATPVLNAVGRPIGVLSASSTDPDLPLDGEPALVELEASAGRIARLLTDLWGWDDGIGSAPGVPDEDESGPLEGR